MALRISSALTDRIVAEAQQSPAEEICGLLLGSADHVVELLPCANVAADPGRRFEVDPATLLAAYRRARSGGPAIVGCYHSHPSGSTLPSRCDAADAASNNWIWIIAAGTKTGIWRAVPHGAVHGRFDPVALIPD